jgi:hypothetical protein
MGKQKGATPEKELNAKRELFCRHYAQGEGTFGNATLSYAAAYDIDLQFINKTDRWGNQVQQPVDLGRYNVCSVNGSRLLRDAKVKKRVQELRLELLNDEFVDAELVNVIQQNEERGPKVAAIREFNKLRMRIVDITKDISTRLPFGETDLSTVIATLPQERQDYFYGVITSLIEEAELQRRAPKA